ncbi:MAG: ferric reductase-like transmembrane domain-containing protein [Pseudoclavibacter sp.]
MTAAPVSRSTARPRGAAAPIGPYSRWWWAGAILVVWATSLFVLALWVSGGGVQTLWGGPGSALTSLGRITGLGAANLLLLQVVFMARVPVLERGFGHDALTRWHRWLGFWSFWLMLAHIALIVAGYAVAGRSDYWAQLWDMIWNFPGMLLAAVGTLLLVGIVAVSLRAARHRLRYENWHLLHLYAYVGVGLALPHQLWSGADFTASAAAAVFWWTLWAAAAAAVVVYRIVVPLVRSARAGLRVAAVRPDGSRGATVTVHGRRLGTLGVRPGQFFVWRFLDGPGWTRGHPFSISAAPSGDRLQITARIVGDGTRRLTRLRPGTRVLIEGPYGTLAAHRRSGSRLLLLAAGAGVAPIVSLLEAMPFRPRQALLVVRDTAKEESLLVPEIDRLAAERGLAVVRMPGHRADTASSWLSSEYRGWDGADAIRSMLPGSLADADAYVCGPPRWMASAVTDLKRAGFRRERIHQEAFGV